MRKILMQNFRKDRMIFVFLTLILFPIAIAGQTSKFHVEYNTTDGKLTKSDLVKDEFGRYDGYQLPLNKGEYAYFVIFSDDFSPNLVLLDPNGEVYQKSSSEGEKYVSVGINVPVGGEWILYVIGDSDALGSYFLQSGFTDSTSLHIDKNADFCTGIDYLTAHANGYFVFLQSLPTEDPLYKIKGAIDATISGDDASYSAAFYRGENREDAEKAYNSLVEKLTACPVLKAWKGKKTDMHAVESWKEEEYMLSENKRGSQRYIQVLFSDLSEATDADYPDDYTVELNITKK